MIVQRVPHIETPQEAFLKRKNKLRAEILKVINDHRNEIVRKATNNQTNRIVAEEKDLEPYYVTYDILFDELSLQFKFDEEEGR